MLGLDDEREMRLKKEGVRGMMFNKKAGAFVDTEEQMELKERNSGSNRKAMPFG